MIKIVFYTGEYETKTVDGEEVEQEIIEDTSYIDYPDEKESAAKLMVESWNQDAGYTSDGPHYAVVSY